MGGGVMTIRNLRHVVGVLGVLVCGACAKPSVTELTKTSPYAKVVNADYRVVAEVSAYGIYKDLDKKEILYLTLIPGVGIAGPEVAFKTRVRKGQEIKVLSAWRTKGLFSDDVYYIVSLPGTDFPPNIEVQLELSRGNEGEGAELNPRIYERQTR